MNIKLNFHPSFEEIASFLPSLKQEFEEKGCGMYCHWDTILSCCKNGHIITLILDEIPISFVMWLRDVKVVEFKIIWMLPEYRGKSLGCKFLQLLFKEFRKRGDIAITINCSTKDGLKLAERNDFSPQNINARFCNENIELGTQAQYIKILRNTQALYFDDEDLVILCYEYYKKEYIFFTKICFSADFEKQPVYWYLNSSWKCKVLYKGKLIREDMMECILKDLRIPLFKDSVAIIDHKITIPNYW